MNGRRNNRKRNNENIKNKKIMRCNTHNKPVFNLDVCDQFTAKSESNTQKDCEHCMHSY